MLQSNAKCENVKVKRAVVEPRIKKEPIEAWKKLR